MFTKRLIGVICLLGMLSAPVIAGAGEWQWHSPLPQGMGLNGIEFADANTVVAVGENGALVRSTDGGLTWTVAPPLPCTGYALDFSDATHGTVVGWNGRIFRSLDGGITWVEQTSVAAPSLTGVDFFDNNIGYAVGGGYVLGTTDGGATWSKLETGSFNASIEVACPSATTAYVVGGAGEVVKTTDGGSTWTAVNTGTPAALADVHFFDTLHGLVVGSSGVIMRTTNGGSTWSVVVTGSTANHISVSFADASHGTIIGFDGEILHTEDGGVTWTVQANPVPERVYDVAMFGTSIGVIAGAMGQILHTADGGLNWNNSGSGPYENLNGLDFSSDLVGTAVGAEGVIMRTVDGGVTWQRQTSSAFLTLNDVAFADDNVGLAVGEGGTVIQTTNGGALWLPRSPGSAYPVYGVDMFDTSLALAVGYAGRIVRSVTGGVNWGLVATPTAQPLYAVHFVDATTVLAVGNGGTILRSTNAGQSWSQIISGTTRNLRGIDFRDALHGVVVGAWGTVLRTSDGGASWDLQNAGFRALWDVQMIDADFWVASADAGNVVKSLDGGVTWTDEPTLSSGNLNGIHVTAGGVATVAGSFGHIMSGVLDQSVSYSLFVSAGYVGWTEFGPDILIGLQGITSPGEIVVNYRSDPLDLPAGYAVVGTGKYYDIESTVGLSVPLSMTIDYDPAGVAGAEEDLQLWHWDETLDPPAWVDITDYVGTDGHVISGTTTSFSPFVIVEPTVVSGVADLPVAAPEMSTASPNPFNPATELRLEIPTAQRVEIVVYDVAGRLVAELADRVFPAGGHKVSWDGRDRSGRSVVSGMYFALMRADGAIQVRKMTLLK